MQKTIQVTFKAELGRVTEEKDIVEEKLKLMAERLKNKTSELNTVIGLPLDDMGKREEQEFMKDKRIEELEADLLASEDKANNL